MSIEFPGGNPGPDDEWLEVMHLIAGQWQMLNNWERDLLIECSPHELTKDQQKSLHEIYYERVIEKIPGRDRQKE